MRPLAQTFVINEPFDGAEAVFLTAVDIFFRSKPSLTSMGVEIQIRETLGGEPLSKQLPYASKTLTAADVQISSDATLATRFTFDTPVMVRTNEIFAIAVLPLGGSPDFRVWTAQRDAIDVTTSAQVVFPNSVGNLYAPSNDLSYTIIQNQCLKFNIVTANFTASSGTAVYKQAALEFFQTRPTIGTFAEGERIVISNNNLKLAALTVTPSSPFTIGEVVVQPNTATNTASATAFGTVYLSNSTITLLSNTTGKFSTTGGGLNGLTSTIKTVNPSVAHTNTVISSACNIITVPTTTTPDSDFANGNFIYFGKPTLANTQVARITAVNPATRQLTLDRTVSISENDASYGRVKSDGNLYGFIAYVNELTSATITAAFNSSANSTENFSSSNGSILIGTDTGATAVVDTLTNIFYDSITSQISAVDSKDTDIDFSFRGYGNNNAVDAVFTNIFSDIPYEFVDKQRIIYSKSNEITNLSGTKSLTVEADLQASSSRFSPYLDDIKSNAIITSNQIRPEAELNGFYLNIQNPTGLFTRESVVFQSNATSNTSGKISFANSSFIAVYDVTTTNTAQFATFTANSTSVITSVSGAIANVTTVSSFNEALGNGSTIPSRYISKTVVLAEDQDSEDMVVFLTAYRPQGTNIKVFTKLLNATDSDPFDDKSWTPMIDTTPFLFSSLANRDDYVELKFDLPQTVLVHTSNIAVNTTSSVITFTNARTTEEFTPGMFVYVADTATQTFAVRRVLSVPNTSALVVRSNLTFNSSNAAIGHIPESIAQCNAFRYNENNGIVRYVCSSTDSVFDGYKTFAIKIVLTSGTTQIVPRVADMRTLALQI
jgi:uncharacterized protein YbaA (DUF1428 family)